MRFESPMTKFSNVSVEVTELFCVRLVGRGAVGRDGLRGWYLVERRATGAAAACWFGVLAESRNRGSCDWRHLLGSRRCDLDGRCG